MDPIHPIRPVTEQPAAIDPVRRITRAGDDPPEREQPPPRRKRPPAPQPAVTADGHVDVQA